MNLESKMEKSTNTHTILGNFNSPPTLSFFFFYFFIFWSRERSYYKAIYSICQEIKKILTYLKTNDPELVLPQVVQQYQGQFPPASRERLYITRKYIGC